MDSDESSGAFIDQAEVGVPFDLRERHFCSETVSEQSSSERLSSSPVMISPPGTGTPVYINSQPESIDLDSNSSSLGDLSIINYDSLWSKITSLFGSLFVSSECDLGRRKPSLQIVNSKIFI